MSSATENWVGSAAPAVGATDANVMEEVGQVNGALLKPFAANYDREGIYPEEAMRGFGGAGLYSAHLTGFGSSANVDMMTAIDAMAIVGETCLSTAFCVWCQDACGWYLEKSPNENLRSKLLPEVATGKRLGGTGLSNPMKFYSGIESIRIKGKRVAGGYSVSGSLPWVSNLGSDHLFGIVFEVEGGAEHRVMAMVDCAQEGLKLGDGGRMIALEGSRTYSTRFRDCFISDDWLLADSADDYIAKIRPGFVLMQVGMALGLTRACVNLMKKLEPRLGHVNQYLDDGPAQICDEIYAMHERVVELAATPDRADVEYFSACLSSRLEGGELALRAATSSMLHAGARGYLERSEYFRRLREAYFVAVVTPATKHLRKQIDMLS